MATPQFLLQLLVSLGMSFSDLEQTTFDHSFEIDHRMMPPSLMRTPTQKLCLSLPIDTSSTTSGGEN